MKATQGKGYNVNQTSGEPRVTDKGIVFSMQVDSKAREILISKEALDKLSALKNIDSGDADPLELFHAFRSTIHEIARRQLAAGGGADSPLVLSPASIR